MLLSFKDFVSKNQTEFIIIQLSAEITLTGFERNYDERF
jgi:hypothetical protein